MKSYLFLRMTLKTIFFSGVWKFARNFLPSFLTTTCAQFYKDRPRVLTLQVHIASRRCEAAGDVTSSRPND